MVSRARGRSSNKKGGDGAAASEACFTLGMVDDAGVHASGGSLLCL